MPNLQQPELPQPPLNLSIHTNSWADFLAADLAAAQYTIHASTLSIVPPTPRQTGPWPRLWRTILTAPDRGVPTFLAIPRPTRVHPATLTNARAAEMLARAGVSISWCDAPPLVHAKAWAIDDAIIWTGSGNLTQSAVCSNRECWVRAYSPTLAPILREWLRTLPLKK